MRTLELSPLYRSTIGFDRLFDLLDSSVRPDWPPYDIEKLNDDEYRISMAVAGFAQSEIEITQEGANLLVVGHKDAVEDGGQMLHRGIATRSFKQIFNLADHVKVAAANLADRSGHAEGELEMIDSDSELITKGTVSKRLSSPQSVAHDPTMTIEHKRSVLASWASDARAVTDHPSLRRLDDGTVVAIDDILAALKLLDGTVEGSPALSRRDQAYGRGHWSRLARVWRRGRRDDDDDPPTPAPAAPLSPLPVLEGSAVTAA